MIPSSQMNLYGPPQALAKSVISQSTDDVGRIGMVALGDT